MLDCWAPARPFLSHCTELCWTFPCASVRHPPVLTVVLLCSVFSKAVEGAQPWAGTTPKHWKFPLTQGQLLNDRNSRWFINAPDAPPPNESILRCVLHSAVGMGLSPGGHSGNQFLNVLFIGFLPLSILHSSLRHCFLGSTPK